MQNTRASWALIPVAMLLTISALGLARLSFGLLLPSMRSDLGLSIDQAGFLGTATSLGYLLALLFAANYAATKGARPSILLGLPILIIGFISLAFVKQYWSMCLAMALLGVGTAYVFTPLVALMVGWYPRHRGMAIGAANSGVGLGIFLCGIFVPLIIGHFGDAAWRQIWLIFAAVTFFTTGLSLLVIQNAPGTPVKNALGPGAWPSVLSNAPMRLLAAIYGVLGTTYIVQSVFAYSYALESGISPAAAGTIVSIQGLALIFGSPMGGQVSDRIGRSKTLVLGYCIMALLFVAPTLWPSLGVFAFHFIGMGFFMPFLFSTILAASSEYVDLPLIPLAVTMITFVFAVGQLIGPALAGVWIDWRGEYQSCFWILTLLMLLGVALSRRLAHYERAKD